MTRCRLFTAYEPAAPISTQLGSKTPELRQGQLQVKPKSEPPTGLYGFWQNHRQSILLGMSALANVGLAVIAFKAYQQEGIEEETSTLSLKN